jgi:hypothetical protein
VKVTICPFVNLLGCPKFENSLKERDYARRIDKSTDENDTNEQDENDTNQTQMTLLWERRRLRQLLGRKCDNIRPKQFKVYNSAFRQSTLVL